MNGFVFPDAIKALADKVMAGERLSPSEGILLWQQAELPSLVYMANHVKQKKNGNLVFFNRNIHIEPTNICIRQCRFCSYYRRKGEPGAWNMDQDEILRLIEPHQDITEIHITGGLQPEKDLDWYIRLITAAGKLKPGVHIKALTAEELDYLAQKAGLPVEEVLLRLKAAGLGSIPGGGAEIFDEKIRNKICPEKIPAHRWLEIHKAAHHIGIRSNATMLFGHIETIRHRIRHMQLLRELQDITGGFNAFIPLKFKSAGNGLSAIGETGLLDVIKTFAMARIFLDNVPHIKSYWPMLGKENAALMLSFGADDLDGTIHDSTKIYAMAGAEEKHPSLSEEEASAMIRLAGYTPAERDSYYKILRICG